jgi:hypothetical protein
MLHIITILQDEMESTYHLLLFVVSNVLTTFYHLPIVEEILKKDSISDILPCELL